MITIDVKKLLLNVEDHKIEEIFGTSPRDLLNFSDEFNSNCSTALIHSLKQIRYVLMVPSTSQSSRKYYKYFGFYFQQNRSGSWLVNKIEKPFITTIRKDTYENPTEKTAHRTISAKENIKNHLKKTFLISRSSIQDIIPRKWDGYQACAPFFLDVEYQILYQYEDYFVFLDAEPFSRYSNSFGVFATSKDLKKQLGSDTIFVKESSRSDQKVHVLIPQPDLPDSWQIR